MHGQLYVPIETVKLGDYPNMFVKDQTLVEEGHPILTQFPHMFRAVSPHYAAPQDEERLEAATANPGQRRA